MPTMSSGIIHPGTGQITFPDNNPSAGSSSSVPSGSTDSSNSSGTLTIDGINLGTPEGYGIFSNVIKPNPNTVNLLFKSLIAGNGITISATDKSIVITNSSQDTDGGGGSGGGITGTVLVSQGGTGLTSIADNTILMGSSTNPLNLIAAPTASNQFLYFDGNKIAWTPFVIQANKIQGLAAVATSGSYTDLINTPTPYTLPIATKLTLGGVIAGAGLEIDSTGIMSADVLSINGKTGDVALIAGEGISIDSSVAPITISTTGLISATELAAITGAGLVGTSNGSTVQQSLTTINDSILEMASMAYKVATTAELRTVDPTKHPLVQRTGYYQDGDGGDMLYVYVATTTPPADNGGTFITAPNGYWSGIHSGEVNLLQFGGIAGNINVADVVSGLTTPNPISNQDSGPALENAIQYCINNYPTKLRIPAGYYYSSWAPGELTRPIRIVGDGWRMSMIQFAPSVTGPLIAPTDVGFKGNGTDYLTDSNVPIASIQDAYAAFELLDISLYGNRYSTLQEGVIFQGDCDHASVRNVMVMQVNGRTLGINPSPITNLRGQIRESEFWHIKSRNCGSAGVYDFDITMSENTNNNDSSNIVNFWGIESIFPYGGSFRITDNRTTTSGPNLYQINFRGCTAHGRFASDTFNTNDLVMLQGNVTGCTLEFYLGYNMSPGTYGFRQIANQATGQAPNHNKISLTFGTVLNGYSIEAGGVHKLELISPFTYGPTGQVLAGTSNIYIDCEGNQPFLKLPVPVTFNNSNAVYLGAGADLPGITTLFPIMPATSGGSGTGDGDTIQVMYEGIQCTLTRSGSPKDSTDTYTITPSISSTQAFVSGLYLSKHLVQPAQYSSVRGRFRFTPRFGYGVNAEFFKVDQTKQYQIGLSGGLYGYITGDSGNNIKLIAPDGSGNPQTILNVLSGQGVSTSSLPIPTWGIAPTFGSYAPGATNLLQLSSQRLWPDTSSAIVRLRFAGHAPNSLTDGLVLQSSQASAVGSEPINPSQGEMNFWNDIKIPGWWSGFAWVPAWGYKWTGTWSSSVSYTIGQAVTYNGVNYVAITSSTNVTPDTHPGNWQVLSQNIASTTPIGASGGDLSGNYPNPVVKTINGGYNAPFIFSKSGLAKTISGSAGSGNQSLATLGTIPAGMLLANGSIEIDVWITTTNNANAKTFMLQLGGVTVTTINLSGSATFRLLLAIQNSNSQTSQVISGNTITTVGNSGVSLNTATIDMTQAQTLNLVGALPTSTDSMTLVRYDVSIRNHS